MPVPMSWIVCGLAGSAAATLSVPWFKPSSTGLKNTETVQEALGFNLRGQSSLSKKPSVTVVLSSLKGCVETLVTATVCGAEVVPRLNSSKKIVLFGLGSNFRADPRPLSDATKVLLTSPVCTIAVNEPASGPATVGLKRTKMVQ